MTSRETVRTRSSRRRLHRALRASLWTALALLLLAGPLLGAKVEKPALRLRANPRASIAPGGRMQRILLSAEILGPEAERYYCPEVVWLLPNGRSAVESDCDPFEERQHYPRFFKKWVRSPPRIRNYEVCIELRKSGREIDRACMRYIVR